MILWLYMQFVSNPLIFGISQFERNGGDPLKRRVTDQVSYLLTQTQKSMKKTSTFSNFILQLFSNFLITWIINHMFETINTIEIIFEISLPKIIQDLYTHTWAA